MRPPPTRNPAILAALEVCRERGHKQPTKGPYRDPRSLTFTAASTTVEDVLWMRENLRAFDRLAIRLEVPERKKKR